MSAMGRSQTFGLDVCNGWKVDVDGSAHHRSLCFEKLKGAVMRRTVIGASLLCLVAGACATHSPPSAALRLSPEQAVMNAAASPDGTSGVFEMPVRAAGRAEGKLFLNSELDYRDPRNLSIAIVPVVEAALAQRFGADPKTYLIGKTIAVRGTAKKTRVVFTAGGRPTDKYYFQTHVRLLAADDLTVSGERPQA